MKGGEDGIDFYPPYPSFELLEEAILKKGRVHLPMLRSNVTYRELTPEEKEKFIKILEND